MALDKWSLLADMTPVYGPGAENTGLGVGMKVPSPGFPTWKAYAALPNGITQAPVDYWADGGYFFLASDAGGCIHRFAIDADGNLTPDGSVTIGGMGLVGTAWNSRQCAWHNEEDCSVILLCRIGAGTSQTPVLGKWLCSSWPFTAANAEWLSPVKSHYGSFKSGEIVMWSIGMINCNTNKFYMSSLYSGQVVRIDTTDGSVDGFWEPYPFYTTAYVINLHGFDADDHPVGGGYHVSMGNKHSWSWDDSDPTSWATITQLLTGSAVATVGQPSWNRAQASNYGGRNQTYPLTAYESKMLGLDDRCAWWVGQRGVGVGEIMLVTFVPVVNGEHQNRTIAHASERRAIVNAGVGPMSFRFVKIDGYAWFVGFNTQSMDQEIENPGGNQTFHIGLMLTPIGPVDISWSGVASMSGVPKVMGLELAPTAIDYMHSMSYGKHRFRMQVTPVATGVPGPWSDWRSGKQLANVDVVVDGKSIWPSFSIGDTVRIDQQMCAGWPYQWDTVSGNPGGVGDPTTPPVGTAEVAPPREVLPMLLYELLPNELGGGFF